MAGRKRVIFIGRWQPFHAGHKKLIESATEENCIPIIGVRNTKEGADNPFSVEQRIDEIRKHIGEDIEVFSIPDFDEIWVGRRVGYKVVRFADDIEEISGTKLREELRKRGNLS